MSKLIVCEKNIAARRIAYILSEGRAKLERIHNVPVYVFHDLPARPAGGPAGRHGRGEEVKCIGLKGHILKVDFPAQYNNWQEINPIKLIDAPIVKVPTQKSILKALQKVAKDADIVVISTDFDREGELIGIDAVNKIREVNPNVKVKRARFSSLTESEIKGAFSNLEDVYISLAQAGEARQDIDLIWGATLTRFLSLASSRLGRQFLSVGRVQSPTLCLIADREKERQEHKPKPYWLVKALFESPGSEQFIALHKIERFWDKREAEAVLSRLGKMGKVVDISTVRKRLKPPTPFNTTAFLSAAAFVGVSPSRAMRIAENLYMEGLISYPRVDNTVYPPSLNFEGILKILEGSPELGNLANLVLRQEKIIPTRGKTEATDHPPIHPTGLAQRKDLKAQEWKIYELVCRRFFGTLALEAVVESIRIDIESGGEPFFVRGSTVVNEGWLKFYPYGRKKDEEVPTLKKGDELKLVKPILRKKETQPPSRYSQGQLIQKMEALGLGTKSTRHEIIKNLYDRGYIHGNPIVPTEMGLAVAEALRRHADTISTPQMTAELEKDMDAIVEGKVARESVVDRSRNILARIMLDLGRKRAVLAGEIREGIREDKIIGKCPRCGMDLKIIRAKKSKKRFIGCTGYPECNMAYPLPQYGEIITLDDVCEACHSPKIKVIRRPPASRGGKSPKPWVLCIDPNCPTKKGSD
ncbi:MAG: DNA topoisomerase I [Actinomycetota bacterium]